MLLYQNFLNSKSSYFKRKGSNYSNGMHYSEPLSLTLRMRPEDV